MKSQRTYCMECGRPRGALEFSCPGCGCAIYDSRSPRAEIQVRPLSGPLTDLPPVGVSAEILLYGARGGGKSTVALMALKRPWVLSTEMEPGLIRSYARRLGVELAGVEFVDFDEQGPTALLPDPGAADGLILDSVNGAGPSRVENIYSWASNAAAGLSVPLILIAQITADQRVRGGEHVPHQVDVVIECRKTATGRELQVEKNRFGPEPSIPWCMPGETAPPYFYAVEGSAGRYRLKPYPWASSEVWDAVSKGKLDRVKPPAAAAAVRSALYRGWVEPPDWEARARFAEARGVHYYRMNNDGD